MKGVNHWQGRSGRLVLALAGYRMQMRKKKDRASEHRTAGVSAPRCSEHSVLSDNHDIHLLLKLVKGPEAAGKFCFSTAARTRPAVGKVSVY